MVLPKGVLLTLIYITVSVFFLTGCSKNSTKDPFAKYPAKNLPRQATNPAQRDVPLKEPPAMTAQEYERSGDSYFNSGNLQQAFLQYDKSLRLTPENPVLRYKIGLLFLLNKMNGDAMQEFQEVIKKEPQNALAYEGMGLALFQQQKSADAERYFSKAIEMNQTLWKSYNCMGIIYDKKKDYKRAIDFYEKAIALKPDNQLLYNNLGLSYLLAGNYDSAINSFDKAMGFRSVPNKVYNNMGLALGLAGRYQESLETFKKVSDEATAYNNMGCVLLMKGEYQKANQAFETAIKLKPSFYTLANENLKKAKTGSGGASNLDFLKEKMQPEIAQAEDFKIEEMPLPKQHPVKQAEKPAPVKKDVPKIKVQNIAGEKPKTAAKASPEVSLAEPVKIGTAAVSKKSEPAATVIKTEQAKDAAPKAAPKAQDGADKAVAAKADVTTLENKADNKPPAPSSVPQAQQGVESKAVSTTAESKEAGSAPVPVPAAPAAQGKANEQTVAKTEAVLPVEGTTAQAPAAEKPDSVMDKGVQDTAPVKNEEPAAAPLANESTKSPALNGQVQENKVVEPVTEVKETAAAIKEEPLLAETPAAKPEEKQAAAVSKEIPPNVNNIPGSAPAAIQKTEQQAQPGQPGAQPEPLKEIESSANKTPADITKSSELVAQPITSSDKPSTAAPGEIVDAGTAKKDAVKAAGTVETEKKAVSEPAVAVKTETPAKDAVQVAAVAAPAGVVKDAAVPIEEKQQAENAQVSAGVETKEVVAPAAGKEVTPEKEAIPSAEPSAQKKADKVAVVKPDAGKDAKQPEPQVEKKNQQTKESSAKSAPKVSQKQGKTAAPKYHVIAKGDTLMSLSRKYNTDPQSLRKINGFSENSILRVGSKIRIE